jgi:hypothetical protein
MLPESFVTWKWTPAKNYRSHYAADNVNALMRGIARHFSAPHRFICVTDDAEGLDPKVEAVPLWTDFADLISPHGGRNPACYRRLRAFHPDIGSVLGQRFVSMDLDTVIVGDLMPVFDRDEEFIALGDTNPTTNYNGGLWMLTAGARARVWTEFDPVESPRLAYQARQFGSDQAWISYCLGPKEAKWTKADGVYSFRNDIRMGGHLPHDARLVSFHGEYDPWMPHVQALTSWVAAHYG